MKGHTNGIGRPVWLYLSIVLFLALILLIYNYNSVTSEREQLRNDLQTAFVDYRRELSEKQGTRLIPALFRCSTLV